jgi:hypothetical protein
MIAELANTISSQDEKIEKSTYQRMLFPAPAKEEKPSVSTIAEKAGDNERLP